jgi:MoxR-like ATPase
MITTDSPTAPAVHAVAPAASTVPASLDDVRRVAQRLRDRMRDQVMGRDDIIELVLVALFADGHVLLEDYPGSGKTTLAKSLGHAIVDDLRQIVLDPRNGLVARGDAVGRPKAPGS